MVVKIVEKFNGGSAAETYLIKKNNEELSVRKIASNTNDLGAQKLFAQWKWLMEVIPKMNYKIFPNINFFIFEKEYSRYDMEYLEGETLKDFILGNQEYFINGDGKDEFTRLILLTLRELLSIKNQGLTKLESTNYIKNKHLKKMIERNNVISGSKLRTSDTLIINGKKCLNLSLALEKIMKDIKLKNFLSPKKLYVSHGDFTLQNMITDGSNFLVIDPRGEGLDSVYYDISKLFQSTNSKYDLIKPGNFTLETDEKFINYSILSGTNVYNDLDKYLRSTIPQYIGEYLDDNWELIAKFYEASHMISMTPFRLKESYEQTVICYAKGIELLNEVLEDWEKLNEK